MGALVSCLTGHKEGDEDDHPGNGNSNHSLHSYLLGKCTSMYRLVRRIHSSSNQEPPSSTPNGAAENSESNAAPASLSFPPAGNSCNSYLEVDGTAIQEGARLNCKEKSEQSKVSSSVSHLKPVAGIDFQCESREECPTCLEEYTVENPKITAKCSHHFHLGCIYEWMERSVTCPICNQLMVFDETT